MPSFLEKTICTGCSACASICPVNCIRMKQDKYGFFYPTIPDSEICTDCRSCEGACPVIRKEVGKEKREKEWIPAAFAAYSKNDELRMDSSSGGIFSELAKSVLSLGGVVYGAAYDDSFAVYHCCIDKKEDLSKLRGAKYSESRLEGIFREIQNRLIVHQPVLFAGTPCQVSGLKSFLGTEYDELLCIDFVCHGIPSPAVWKEYVRYRAEQDNAGSLPTDINLRSKKTGWSRYHYSSLFRYDNGYEKSILSTENLFMKLFVENYLSRPSCSKCRFKGYKRDSDITLGDFWGVWDIMPEMDDDKGTSLVLIQSEKGKEFWNNIQHGLVHKKITLEDAARQNSSLVRASKADPESLEKMNELLEKGFDSFQFPEKENDSYFMRAIKAFRNIIRLP